MHVEIYFITVTVYLHAARARSAIFDLYRSSVNSEIGRPTRLANFARSIDFILLKNRPEFGRHVTGTSTS